MFSPPHIWDLDVLVDIIKASIRSVGALIINFVGDRGSGKSISAINLCCALDKDFNNSRIGFTKEEIRQVFQDYAYEKMGTVVLWDEI
jgi:hypothetical protein